MLPLRTVILRHDRTGDSHLDLLVEHPAHRPHRSPLLAFRIALPSPLQAFIAQPGLPAIVAGSDAAIAPDPRPARRINNTALCRKLLLTQLPLHRRQYLTYQGPVTRRRGRVRRIACGSALISRYTTDRIVMHLQFARTGFQLSLDRIAINTWSAALKPVS